MRNAAIYSSTFDLEQLEQLIRSLYTNHKIKVRSDLTHIEVTSGGFLRPKHKKGFNIMTSQTEPQSFEQMINGMSGFFQQIPAENTQIQQKIQIKISTLNMVIGIETEEDISESFLTELLHITKSLDGLLFWGGGQLLDGEGRLLLNTEGRSEVDDYTVTAPTSHLHREYRITESGEQRKERSHDRLIQLDIPVNHTLPARLGDEEGAQIRSLNEVTARAVAICIAAVKAECIGSGESVDHTRQLISGIIEQYDAYSFFSPEERQFIDAAEPEESEIPKFSWRYEGFWVLMWALGHIDQLGDPDHICDVGHAVSQLQQFDTFEQFVQASRLRTPEEILDEADLIYRYDWACVDSRVHQRPVPGHLDAGVVYERHYALNWLTGYLNQDWDHVRADT